MAVDSVLVSGLGVLAAVVEAGTFVGAASGLGMTQSGVSRAIARLEQRLGARLLDRTPRAVTLTDEGRRFYETAAPLLAGIEEAASLASGSRSAIRGRLRVAVDAAFGHAVLAPAIGEFMAQHPELELELVIRDRIGDLVAEGLDAAVRFGEPEGPSSLVRLQLARFRVVTCAAPAYLERHAAPQRPGDLTQHECILVRDPFTGRPFEWELQRGRSVVKVKVTGRVTVNDAGGLIGAMLSGHGIGQPFEFCVQEHLAAGRLVHLLPSWSDERYPVHLYHRSRDYPSAKVRAFISFVRELVQRPRWLSP
jgi:DNA-binding transcriptional LysR family regulator